jgi:hypothetical protein
VDRATSPVNPLTVRSSDHAIWTVQFRALRICRPLSCEPGRSRIANPLVPSASSRTRSVLLQRSALRLWRLRVSTLAALGLPAGCRDSHRPRPHGLPSPCCSRCLVPQLDTLSPKVGFLFAGTTDDITTKTYRLAMAEQKAPGRRWRKSVGTPTWSWRGASKRRH